MGFSTTLKSNTVNEWKDYYLDYDKLRLRIKNRDFRTMLYNEVNKINSFYFLLERKAVDEKNILFSDIITEFPIESAHEPKTQIRNIDIEDANLSTGVGNTDLDDQDEMDFDTFRSKRLNESGNENKSMLHSEGFASLIPLQKGYTKRKKEKHITEFLHSLVKIKAYRDLNATGLLKLARRYATVNKNEVFYNKFNEKLKETYFYKSKRIDSIRSAVKKMYKQVFAKDQPEKAKTIFKRLGKGTKTLDVFYLMSGLLVGSGVTIAAWLYDLNSEEYRFMTAINNILIGFLFFGLCLKAFKNFSINYKFIFNFDVASSLNNSIYFMIISSMLFLNSFLFLIRSDFESYVVYLQLFFPLAFLFNPLDMFYLNSRIYLISVYTRGILLPMSTIRFRHFYFVDILQSFRFPFEIIVGHFLSESQLKEGYPLMAFSLFPIVRFLQCMRRFYSSRLFFPHVANASKYTLIFMAVFFEAFEKFSSQTDDPNNTLRFLKYIFKLMSTTSSFCWDIFVDWVIPRNRYMFPYMFYIFAAGTNFLVRFYWIISLSFAHLFDVSIPENPILMSVAEIVRRSVWTVIRVEVEHLNNCDELKFKKAINLTAGELFYKKDIDESYQANISNIMTETEFETEMEEKNKTEMETKGATLEYSATEEDSNANNEDINSYENKGSTESHEDTE
ncbi:uncharacterized protein VICG_00900 [Vittaforma corneae ATCC 50505]|uniref:EXS domain-containing protein n=1 Tax=Vittaforma corneae (strain ATCC 50505) TaxID=993615 RepID=L2GMI2_VITCO|nr:uncharacterized protein VICG_00900 [Vittaforma corneae ATCC 50505]ELA42051.1 hypothetical protein VICG_00900 [Vittaforma corneae ATCC 50505]